MKVASLANYLVGWMVDWKAAWLGLTMVVKKVWKLVDEKE